MARSSSSSTLLTEIMQRPMDPGYAAAAARRRGAAEARGTTVVRPEEARDHRVADPPVGTEGSGVPGRPPGPQAAPALRPVLVRLASRLAVRGRRGRSAGVFLLVLLALGLLAGAGVAQLRAGPLAAQDRAVLEAEVQRRTELADTLAADNAVLRQQIDAEQAAAIGDGAASLVAATDELGVLTGAVPVVGDGVEVVLDDAPVDVVGEDGALSDDGRVRDADVQTVVNGLWSAGAEGVAVNGQRLTSLSTIRHAGDAIVVDLRQLARPYTITAVGPTETMLAEVRTGSAGRYAAFLRDSYGVSVSVRSGEGLALPAASRVALRHAVPLVADPEASPGASPGDVGPAEEDQS